MSKCDTGVKKNDTSIIWACLTIAKPGKHLSKK